MTFTVTYRGKDGALREESVEAASRAECVAECRRRGIAPTAIREGRASSRPRATVTSAPHAADAANRRGKLWRAAILAAAVLAVAGGVWWWLAGSRDARPSPAKPPTAAKPKTEKRPDTRVPKPQAPAPSASEATNHVAQAAPVEEPPLPVHVPKYTNIAYRSSARGVLSVHGKPVPPHRRLFKHVSERAIQKLLLVKPGAKVIGNPIPRNFDENFRESLNDEIKFEPEDTPADIEMKKSMIAVKKELADRMAKGESPSQVLKEEIAELRRLAKYRSNLQKQVNELKKDGSEQDAEDLKAAANQMLQENGLKPLPGTKIKAD